MIRKSAFFGCALTALFGLALPACSIQMGTKTPDSPPPAPAPPAAPPPAATTPAPVASTPPAPADVHPSSPPAPAAPSSGVVEKGGSLQLAGKLSFNSGTSTLSSDPNNNTLLTQLKNFMVESEKKIAMVRIEGYTDNQGDPNKNLDLSGQRALTVKNWLIANGIDPNRVVAVGFGQDKPIAPNTTDDGRAQNQRLEYKVAEIYDKKGKAQVYLGGKDPLGGGKEYK
ncbi:MAG TPA: OmpA family protein [Polyangiaceae bacterium]|nr:OmpA family protein [Polyangiaceae bacterium]